MRPLQDFDAEARVRPRWQSKMVSSPTLLRKSANNGKGSTKSPNLASDSGLGEITVLALTTRSCLPSEIAFKHKPRM